MVKGDWAEFAHTLGFPTWANHGNPCFACRCAGGPGGNFANFLGTSPLSVPFPLNDMASYNAACARCEKWVRVPDDAVLQRLLGILEYDKRRSGGKGRCAARDMPELGIVKGMRLEPFAGLRDVAHLDTAVVPPGGLDLLFWDRTRETSVKRRNPLFGEGTRITPQSLAVDELHTLFLGVFQQYILAVLWAAIDEDVFK
eukprot:2853052-Lingulodinium_polyedra.AAC.1